MRRSKRGTKEVAIRYNKLGIYLWEMKEVGGKRETTRFPEGRFTAAYFPLEMFQGDGERWRQLGGKNLSFTTNSVQIVLSIAVLGE